MLGLLDFFRNSISLLKLPFLTSLSQNFSTLCLHRLSKFVDKSPQKSSIFSIKASFERSLFKKFYLMIIFFGKSLQSPLLLAMRIYWGGSLASAGLGKLYDISAISLYFSSLSIPFPTINAYLVLSLIHI